MEGGGSGAESRFALWRMRQRARGSEEKDCDRRKTWLLGKKKKKTAPKQQLRGEQKEREKKNNIKVSQLKPSRDSSLYFH